MRSNARTFTAAISTVSQTACAPRLANIQARTRPGIIQIIESPFRVNKKKSARDLAIRGAEREWAITSEANCSLFGWLRIGRYVGE